MQTMGQSMPPIDMPQEMIERALEQKAKWDNLVLWSQKSSKNPDQHTIAIKIAKFIAQGVWDNQRPKIITLLKHKQDNDLPGYSATQIQSAQTSFEYLLHYMQTSNHHQNYQDLCSYQVIMQDWIARCLLADRDLPYQDLCNLVEAAMLTKPGGDDCAWKDATNIQAALEQAKVFLQNTKVAAGSEVPGSSAPPPVLFNAVQTSEDQQLTARQKIRKAREAFLNEQSTEMKSATRRKS